MINKPIVLTKLFIRHSLQFYSQPKKDIRYRFDHTAHSISHYGKQFHGWGDDAFFTSSNVLAVADGVGAWAMSDIDAGRYSRKLCKLIGLVVQNEPDFAINKPKELVEQVVKLNGQIGSSTITVITLHPITRVIKAYYIGDSVYGFFTEKQVQIVGEQQKRFNCPFQVGTGGDDPSLGIIEQYQPQHMDPQDVLILGTDGLWNNLTLDQIHFEVRGNAALELNGSYKPLHIIGHDLVNLCYDFSIRGDYESPFYHKALKAGKVYPRQGRVDDITIIIAKIIQ